MKILELFAGSRSVGKVAKSLGHEVFSTDIEPYEGIDYVVDIMDFDYAKVPWIPDMIWASPPCEGFSVAAIGKNWNRDYTPKSSSARRSVKLVEKTIEVIERTEAKFWYIENPRGMLRKLGLIWGLPHTVTYCQYGDNRMKPTDIWTNNMNWKSRMPCKNGDKCHVAAPRGAKTGTQGRKGSYERSKIPSALIEEILKSHDN